MAKAKMPVSFGKSFAASLDKTFRTIKSPTYAVGFSNVNTWADFGNYALNRIMSGRFDKGLLFGRKYIFYGESGSGKSLMAAVCAGRSQKSDGSHVVWIDIEKANDQEEGRNWLKNAGIDIEHEGFHYLRAGTILDARAILANVCTSYRKAQENLEEGMTLPPLIVVIDSWAMLNTVTQMEAAGKGELKHDRGLRIQEIGQIIIDCVHMTSGLPILMIGVQHIMDSQEQYGPRHKTTGGNKMLYAASGCLMLTKKRLVNDDMEDKQANSLLKQMAEKMSGEHKKKITEGKRSMGITCVAENIKSRASKPYERVEIQIPYTTGIDPYSGLFDVLMIEGAITTEKTGWYKYKNSEGKEVNFQRGAFRTHAAEIMKVVQPDVSVFDATAPAQVAPEEMEESADVEA